MKKVLLALCVLVFVLSACAPSATQTPLPTYTPYPTYTPFPSQTSTPTSTPTMTPTFTPTTRPTYTPLPTYTLVPPTNTMMPKTATAISVQATQLAKYAARTATAVAKQATATEIASYNKLPDREIMTYSPNHGGEKVVIRGVVYNIKVDERTIQLYLSGNWDDDVFVTMDEPFTGIYVGHGITIYGYIDPAGTITYTTKSGDKWREPYIHGQFFIYGG